MREKHITPGFVEEFYNKKAKDESISYEYQRWAINELRWRDYHQTKNIIEYYMNGGKCSSLLEIGCGPGTWTKIIYGNARQITVVDISSEMIELARKAFVDKDIEYIKGDFQDSSILQGRVYDVIFSCRAAEYMNKEKVVKKSFELLNEGGRVYIITKNPLALFRLIDNIIKKFKKISPDSSRFHAGQISPFYFKRLFEKGGFRKIRIFPVIFDFYIPGTRLKFIRKAQLILSNYFWRLNFKKKLNFILLPFIESYLVIAEK